MHDEQRELKAGAEVACEVVNRKLGWRAANPEYHAPFLVRGRRPGYTGRIVISRRGAEELTKLIRAC